MIALIMYLEWGLIHRKGIKHVNSFPLHLNLITLRFNLGFDVNAQSSY